MNRWTSVLLAFGGLIAFPLVDSAIKGTLILFLAAAVCLWLRRDSAATRHFVWTIAIGLLVTMPVLSLVLPQWRILPGWMNSEPVTLREIALPTSPSKATLVEANVIDEPAQPIAIEDLPADMSGDASDALNVPVPMTETSPAGEVSAIGPVEETATTLPAWISVTWLIGCALLLVRLSIAAVLLRRSERRCVVIPCRDRDDRGDWRAGDVSPLMNAKNRNQGIDIPRSPEELGIALEQSKLALGLKRPVAVLIDPKRSIPIVWGLWKTRLQLPEEVLQWSDEQLQSVLLHELAHVRRRDLFVLALTQIACALHWFNPLVWIAAWRLHVERERACDDLVLNTGIRASSYAEHLLNVATRLTSSQWTQACGLAMARSSSLHGRLSAVLSEKQNRRSVTLAMTIMTLFCSLSVGIPMAMLRGADEVAQETPASQTTEEAKPDAAPDEAPQPIVNNLGSSGNYRPAAILPRIPRTAPTNNRDSTRPLLERLSDDPDQRAKELVYLLRDYRIWIRSDEWAEATRELVKLGDVALPYLIAELDRTDRDQTIRVVAFALRAINNPRAVPALIRAVPKALRPPGSDCGVYVRTKELHEFMSAIDDSPGVDDDVSLGRPVTEIFSALEHLTLHKFGADQEELRYVFLEDPADEAKLRKQFADRQREWEIWWSEHGPELIPAAELPRWNQASAKTLDGAGRDDIERAGIARFGELFPTGPDVRLGPVRELELSWPGFADSVCAIDFDEHRGIRRFELYDDGGRHFQAVHSGADLSASELVKEYDLCLWHSTNEQWSSIDQDIPNGQRISIAREAHQRTLRAATGQQTYVFLTREGGQGIVQIDELDQSRYTRKIRYRMWNDTDVLASVGLPKPDSPSTVSWSAVHKARLAAPGPQSLSAWSLNNHQAVALPDSTPKDFFERGRFSEFYSSPEFANWMIDKEVSLIFVWADYTHNRRNLPEDYLKTIRHLPAIQVMNCRHATLISADGFESLSAADARELSDVLLDVNSLSSSHVIPGTHQSGTASTDAAVFHLADGTVGLFEITNRHAADGAIEFRYKTVVTAKKADGRRVDASSDRTEPATVDAADDVVIATWDHIDLHTILRVDSLPADLTNVLPGSVKQLDGKRVRLRGYMYPTFEATGLTKFVICRHNAAMMLSHSPLLDQIVNVHLSADTDTNYIEGRPFDVEGIFRVKPAFDGNQKLSGLYLMEDAQIDLRLPGRKRTNRNRADSSPSRSPEVGDDDELVRLYQFEDAQILQLHSRTSVRKKGIPVSSASAEKSMVNAPEYRAAFEHGEYDLGGGRTLRVRAIHQQQQSLTIEWPSEKPSEVYSWTMFPEAPDRNDFRMSPEKPWSQTTGWGVVWHTDSDTVWIADGSRRIKLNIAEPTAITINDAGYNVTIEHAFRKHLGMLAGLPSRDEMRQFTLFLTPKVLEGALAKVKEQQEEGKRSTDVRVEAAKLKKIRN